MEKKWHKQRKRLFEIVEVGYSLDFVSRMYDLLNVLAIVLNLVASILYTFDEIRDRYATIILAVEGITVAFFLIDYLLRVFTATFLYPDEKESKAILKYMFSFMGIVDLLSFLPYCLPVFFPAGTIAFRMIRIIRIFRLFRINAYHDSLSVITSVIVERGQQLVASVFIIVVLMLASSLCMYSLEHEAQPEVFSNAFSGIWWATSTLLTVGYGDIYPITTLGKLFGILISFLGVGMVAIPTGIISAGFVNQYSRIKKSAEYGREADMQFIKVYMEENDAWIGKKISDLKLPSGMIISVIKREDEILIPRGDLVIEVEDLVVIGAEPFNTREHIQLKEIIIRKQHPWVGAKIDEIDISRHSIIVLIKRRSRTLIPNGNTVLRAGDKLFMYTQLHFSGAKDIEV
ncbi:MAG: ion transporter [Lachnospiraceae bacterium]|nr:ion transporter [Lachnospiraceae bacterium]